MQCCLNKSGWKCIFHPSCLSGRLLVFRSLNSTVWGKTAQTVTSWMLHFSVFQLKLVYSIAESRIKDSHIQTVRSNTNVRISIKRLIDVLRSDQVKENGFRRAECESKEYEKGCLQGKVEQIIKALHKRLITSYRHVNV